MVLDEQGQIRVWILCQKVLYESPNLDKMLSNFQVLANIYSYDTDDAKLKKKLIEQVKKIKDFRKHNIVRKQSVIIDLKIECDDIISEMVHTIDPKIMQMFSAFEPNA